MAVEIFLRLDGVSGGSRSYHHKGWSDVVSWSWGLSGRGAGGGAANAPALDQLCVVKRIGMESPAIMSLCALGGVVPTAEISIVPVVGKRDAQQKYLSIALEKVRVRTIATAGNTEENFSTETLTLDFEKVKFEYHHYADATPDAPTGAIQSHAFSWDVALGAPA